MVDHITEAIEAANKRNDVLYAWLRQILLMATGALSVMVSLDSSAGSTPLSKFLMHLAWTAIGLGILSGASALYAEVVLHQSIVEIRLVEYREAIRLKGEGSAVDEPGPVIGKGANWLPFALRACWFSLSIALVLVIASAWFRA
jgi:hypothetical protein